MKLRRIAQNHWDESSELAYAKAVIGKKHQDDLAHPWYRRSQRSSGAGRLEPTGSRGGGRSHVQMGALVGDGLDASGGGAE